MSLVNIVNFPSLSDHRGELVVLEQNDLVPFDIKRVYYIYNNLKNITCYSNEENKWRQTKAKFIDNNNLELLLEGKFITERGRINCSLNAGNGYWRWLGMQFVIAKIKG